MSGAQHSTHAASRPRSRRLWGRERAPTSSGAERASSRLGPTARSGPEHPDAASLLGNQVRDEQVRCGARELCRAQAVARSVLSTRARPNAHVPSPRIAGRAVPPSERRRLETALQRRGGERVRGPSTQSSASPCPRSQPRAPPIAASATSIAARDVSAFCSERSRAPSCSPTAGRATRTPADTTNQHAPLPEEESAVLAQREGAPWSSPGRTTPRSGPTSGSATRWALRAVARRRLLARSGWFPCGTSTAIPPGASTGRWTALCGERLVSLRNQHGY